MDGPLLLVLLAAPFAGSFLGVLIRRLPDGRPAVLSRSACEHCGSRLAARDLVPLFSYVAARGRCRYCHASIGGFHPLVELLALGMAAIVACAGYMRFSTPAPVWVWSGCALGWTLLALGWIDLKTLRLPDALTLPLLLGGLLSCRLLSPAAVPEHTIAAVMGYGGFRLVALIYRRLRGCEGLGMGDAKLLAAAGAWTGPAALPLIVAGGAIVTLVATGVAYTALSLRRRADAGPTHGERGHVTAIRIPFGPGLGLMTWLVFLSGVGGGAS
ncbi:A24 family peptidase [Gluconacetobacter entanii]|uniref:Prepilin leader peptidase/N-methyltransferase n=1 Tax=Gluconacetobacter entanii TaxID=108528 RepID=A0ABT3KAB5_9PROT|nr:A24 family peptidase [Gluconacetobacter entanii]MCW4592384.1 A24 family peptidase [Gluconacetobacter entanii]MCW4595606.1 A24 family peptidase [Gluconacetobacter entanii]NPC87597.1 prepilin peptidase [Gluconacetobacter entanii]